MKTYIASTSEQEIVYQAICKIITANIDAIGPQVMLAIFSNFVGKFIAMQVEDDLPMRDALEIVTENMKIGNKEFCDKEARAEGSVH